MDPVGSISNTPIYRQIAQDKAAGLKVWMVFGLSANPIHLGHTDYLSRFDTALKPDRVIVIPNRVSPHKSATEQCTREQKRSMVQAAIKDHSHWELDTQELDNDRPSYTWMTVDALTKEAGTAAKIYLLLTAESAASFHTWYYPSAPQNRTETPEEELRRRNFIIDRVTIVYGVRPDTEWTHARVVERIRKIQELAAGGVKCDTVVDLPGGQTVIKEKEIRPVTDELVGALENGYVPVQGDVAVSSTQIRELCGQYKGEELTKKLEPLVGKSVAQLLVEQGVYRKTFKKLAFDYVG